MSITYFAEENKSKKICFNCYSEKIYYVTGVSNHKGYTYKCKKCEADDGDLSKCKELKEEQEKIQKEYKKEWDVDMDLKTYLWCTVKDTNHYGEDSKEYKFLIKYLDKIDLLRNGKLIK
jgi:hypothetical protein